jgi:hypothetical protein
MTLEEPRWSWDTAAHAGSELTNLLPQPPKLLALQMCTTMLGAGFFLDPQQQLRVMFGEGALWPFVKHADET